jgi:hypothetical protein
VECHPAFAGYLQAAGVVVAILASAIFTRMTVAPVREDRTRRGQVVIYRLMPPVSNILATARRVRTVFDQTKFGMMLAVEDRLDEAVFYFSIDTPIPAEVLAELYTVDDILAEEVAQLHYYLAAFNEFVRLNVPRLRGFDGQARDKFKERFEDLLGAVETLSNNVWQRLKEVRRPLPSAE